MISMARFHQICGLYHFSILYLLLIIFFLHFFLFYILSSFPNQVLFAILGISISHFFYRFSVFLNFTRHIILSMVFGQNFNVTYSLFGLQFLYLFLIPLRTFLKIILELYTQIPLFYMIQLQPLPLRHIHSTKVEDF